MSWCADFEFRVTHRVNVMWNGLGLPFERFGQPDLSERHGFWFAWAVRPNNHWNATGGPTTTRGRRREGVVDVGRCVPNDQRAG